MMPAEFRRWVVAEGGDAAFYFLCGSLSYAEDAWKDDASLEAFLRSLTAHEKAALFLKFNAPQP
jgi:hypothetical protein